MFAAGHLRELIGVQAAAGDEVAGVDFLAAFRREADEGGLLSDPGDLRAEVELCAHLFGVLSVMRGDAAPIDDAGDGGEDRLHAAAIRFALADLPRIEEFQAFDAVLLSALPEIHQARNFRLFGGDDQLADLLVRNVVLLEVLPSELTAFDAELGLKGAGLIIDAGVDDAAIATGLMLVVGVLFFDVHHLEVWVAQQQFPGGREADDSSANDRNVIDHKCVPSL